MPRPLQSLAEYFATWDMDRDVAEARRIADRARFQIYVVPKWGRIRVDRIRSSAVQAWMDSPKWAAYRGGKVAQADVGPATRYASLMVLRQTLEIPTVAGVISRNPALGIRSPGATNAVTPVKENAVLTAEEADRLVEQMDEHYQALALMGLRLGLTWAEALGLQVVDIDFPSHSVHVGRLLGVESQGIVEVREGDLKAQRNLRMPRDLENALAGYLARSEPIRDPKEPWVFLTSRGRHPLRANYNRYVLRPALEAAGLPMTGTTFHTFRHTAARDMLQAGESLEHVQFALGHQDVQTTRRFYGDLAVEEDVPRTP